MVGHQTRSQENDGSPFCRIRDHHFNGCVLFMREILRSAIQLWGMTLKRVVSWKLSVI